MQVPARQRVLDALLTLTAEKGLEGVSIREVARAADTSNGTVQYYCRSKDEMLRMAYEDVNQRILTRATGVERSGQVGDVLLNAMLEFLPLTASRAVEAKVYLAFTARAAVSEELAAVRHALIAEQHDLCADALRLAQEREQAVTDFDADRVAHATVALVDGLLVNLLTDPSGMTDTDAIAVLRDHLARYVTLTS